MSNVFSAVKNEILDRPCLYLGLFAFAVNISILGSHFFVTNRLESIIEEHKAGGGLIEREVCSPAMDEFGIHFCLNMLVNSLVMCLFMCCLNRYRRQFAASDFFDNISYFFKLDLVLVAVCSWTFIGYFLALDTISYHDCLFEDVIFENGVYYSSEKGPIVEVSPYNGIQILHALVVWSLFSHFVTFLAFLIDYFCSSSRQRQEAIVPIERQEEKSTDYSCFFGPVESNVAGDDQAIQNFLLDLERP